MPLKSRIPVIAAGLDTLVDQAVEHTAEFVKQSAQARVPVQTGRLRDAIHVESDKDGTYVVAGDTEAWYGHLVEHGTSHTPPHPFLIPAFEENRDAIVSAVNIALKAIQ